jgi:H+/Cl- antiporter ClcA
MSKQFSIAQIFLWLFVIALGIMIGGGLYEQLVVMPLWQSAPPDSVIAYYQHNVANPQHTLNQGGRFWAFVMPLVGLLAIVTLISGLRTRPEHRKWRIAATVLTLIIMVWGWTHFLPPKSSPAPTPGNSVIESD